jgi:hypothetical protein
MAADPPISKEALENQLSLLGFKDTGITSPDRTSKVWINPSGDNVVISNQPWIPAYVFHKLLRELDIDAPGVYGTPN